ncbi:phage gp6-like head-tail connector protein [Halobacillus litoralis]|nr:phage gp6-like head-tail connector protein [Halobacillus litoralis]MCA1021798.1 phage gp6-like head-tail connector protein [Halobacillus litoralis]
MHISHGAEDSNLKRLLSFSVAYLKGKCGKFDIEDGSIMENVKAKELTFERARYAYNDAVEYFEDNFLHDIHSLGLDISFKDMEDIYDA